VKMLCSNPPKGTTLREYASVGVSHVKIGSTAYALSPWKDFAYKERNLKNMWQIWLYGEKKPLGRC